MEPLHVSVDSWIIQDGNYPDFRVGQTSKFALEFYHHTLSSDATASRERIHILGSTYRVRAQVIFTAPSVWVVDFGVMSYQNGSAPSMAKRGAWIAAEITLGIDPFFYFEGLHSVRGMPHLQYQFRIQQILLETTPWLKSKDERGRDLYQRDEANKSFRPVAETNAWEDDEGHANYILECHPVTSV